MEFKGVANCGEAAIGEYGISGRAASREEQNQDNRAQVMSKRRSKNVKL